MFGTGPPDGAEIGVLSRVTLSKKRTQTTTQEEKVECLFVLNHDHLKQQSQIRKYHVALQQGHGKPTIISVNRMNTSHFLLVPLALAWGKISIYH